ncbi:hypothetical protein pb186bvf_008916 [Paramecium bursaria]
MEAIDNFIMQNLNPLGFDDDKIKLVFYFYLIVPLGFTFRLIKNATFRLLYNLALGLFFTAWIGKGWFIFINAVTIFIYGLTKMKNAYFLVVFAAFAALSYVHIYRQIHDYLSCRFDFNVIQMILTCRYVYYVVDQENSKGGSFLQYYSFIFMFTNLILGPVPFKDFMKLINMEDDQANYSPKDTFISLGKAIIFSLGEVFIRPHIDFDWLYTERWNNMNVFERNLFMIVVSFGVRFRYYTAYKHTQAGMDAIGITYNPETRRCDKFQTAHYEMFEKNVINNTSKWNALVQQWLKYCFYDRLIKQFGNMTFYIVYAISAIWHGFYLIYYLFFLTWAFINQNMKYFYKSQRRFYFLPEWLRHFIAFFYSAATINVIAMAVVILDWDNAIKFYSSLSWAPQILTAIPFLFFYITGYGQNYGKIKQKQKI